jgi:hypothetical protein
MQPIQSMPPLHPIHPIRSIIEAKLFCFTAARGA